MTQLLEEVKSVQSALAFRITKVALNKYALQLRQEAKKLHEVDDHKRLREIRGELGDISRAKKVLLELCLGGKPKV